MGRKKRQIQILKPFCYYCEKEFNDANILHQHQKNRHFSCKYCTRKFSTAASMSTHALQVHKETVTRVPNAQAERDSLEMNIYGMENVPSEIVEERIYKKFSTKRFKEGDQRASEIIIKAAGPLTKGAPLSMPSIPPVMPQTNSLSQMIPSLTGEKKEGVKFNFELKQLIASAEETKNPETVEPVEQPIETKPKEILVYKDTIFSIEEKRSLMSRYRYEHHKLTETA